MDKITTPIDKFLVEAFNWHANNPSHEANVIDHYFPRRGKPAAPGKGKDMTEPYVYFGVSDALGCLIRMLLDIKPTTIDKLFLEMHADASNAWITYLSKIDSCNGWAIVMRRAYPEHPMVKSAPTLDSYIYEMRKRQLKLVEVDYKKLFDEGILMRYIEHPAEWLDFSLPWDKPEPGYVCYSQKEDAYRKAQGWSWYTRPANFMGQRIWEKDSRIPDEKENLAVFLMGFSDIYKERIPL